MKQLLYVIIIVCFFIAGFLDVKSGNTKEGTVAVLLGITNCVIFLWR